MCTNTNVHKPGITYRLSTGQSDRRCDRPGQDQTRQSDAERRDKRRREQGGGRKDRWHVPTACTYNVRSPANSIQQQPIGRFPPSAPASIAHNNWSPSIFQHPARNRSWSRTITSPILAMTGPVFPNSGRAASTTAPR